VILLTALIGKIQAGVQEDTVYVLKNQGDRWFGDDKIRHAVGSMILTTLSAQIAIRKFDAAQTTGIRTGAGITLGLGFLKETYDQTKEDNFFSYKDLLADIVGITIGILILNIH
jgi:uncharacterized protein YfiM (DUF2279 family)